MNPLDALAFVWGALRGHRLRTALTILGMAIGITGVVGLTALGEGARRYVTAEIASLGSTLVSVLPGKVETAGALPLMGGAPRDLTLEDARALARGILQIRRLAPLVIGEIQASYQGLHRNVTVVGTTSDFQAIRGLHLAQGRFLPPMDLSRSAPLCVIGSGVKGELFRGSNPLGQILRLGDWRCRVIGVIAPRGHSMGLNLDELVYVPVAWAMDIFNQHSLFRILLEAASFQDLERVREQARQILVARHRLEDVTLITQDAVLAAFNRIFRALTLALAAIAGISLTVAGVGILNVMWISVTERMGEIGLLKALGAGSRQVLGLFLLEALVLALGGGVAGLALAWGLTRALDVWIPRLSLELPLWSVLLSLGLSLGLGLLFGAWPAWRAARLDPVQALEGGGRV